MRKKSFLVSSAILLFLCLVLVSACVPGASDGSDESDTSDDSDNDSGDDTQPDDDASDDDLIDDDFDDSADDSADDATDDDTTDVPPAPNPNAKADAFKLFYKERAARTILSFNRFALAGDAVAATAFGKMAVAKSGNEYEIVPGPNDNNPIGFSVYTAWKLYQSIGGRDIELSLIRMFEGLVFNERVSGHPGITVREALPGWTRVMDGAGGGVERTNFGSPVTPPVAYPPALEQEILDAFYDGVIFTYRENPLEYYFNFKAINELNAFAITFVFDQLPDFLRISNCCSSWMISKLGVWEGAFWGNHNSRDNFTDYVMGYLAAFEAEATDGLPADLAQAAHNAADAARRTGDTTVANGNILMTVDEHHDYNTLRPAGETRPDNTTEWQDLGSLSSCQMAYLAQAISTDGLSAPVPEIPLPGAIETSAIKYLFDQLGIHLPVPVMKCKSVDDAFLGMGWTDIMNAEVFGVPWYEIARAVADIFPDLFPDLVGGMMDDFKELELGAVGLCIFAQHTGDQQLYRESRQTLRSLIRFQRVLADLVYGLMRNPDQYRRIVAAGQGEALQNAAGDAEEMLYIAATYARMFDIDAPLEDFADFGDGVQRGDWIISQLYKSDTAWWPLKTDEEIAQSVFNDLANKEDWIQTRYHDRFGDTVPVRRAGDGYECIGTDDQWMPTENSRHDWFGATRLWFEAPLCVLAPQTLDCTWARLGCAPADLNGSGTADAADQALFDAAWGTYGDGASCSDANDWCDGADLDRSGVLDADDQGFMAAAQGCTT